MATRRSVQVPLHLVNVTYHVVVNERNKVSSSPPRLYVNLPPLATSYILAETIRQLGKPVPEIGFRTVSTARFRPGTLSQALMAASYAGSLKLGGDVKPRRYLSGKARPMLIQTPTGFV